jgi:hypothetical protein
MSDFIMNIDSMEVGYDGGFKYPANEKRTRSA